MALGRSPDGTLPDWLGPRDLRLTQSEDGLGHYELVAHLSTSVPWSTTVERVSIDNWQPSPQGSYTYACLLGRPFLWRTGIDRPAHADAPPQPGAEHMSCASPTAWAPDESAVAFANLDGDLVLWSTDGSKPWKTSVHLALYPSLAWSPDSRQLAIVLEENLNRTSRVGILDRSGVSVGELTVKQGSDGTFLDWLTPGVVASISRDARLFYAVSDGAPLFEWHSVPRGDGIFHQAPVVSPNGRWVFLDQTDDAAGLTDTQRGVKVYSLYDLQERRRVPLSDQAGTFLLSAGWSADSQTLFLIARRGALDSVAPTGLPYGLLAYDPNSATARLLFPDAVRLAWSPNHVKAFVVYRTVAASGNPELYGAFWDPVLDTRSQERRITTDVADIDPAVGFADKAPNNLRLAWSPTGAVLAFSDGQGRLTLLQPQKDDLLLTDQLATDWMQLLWSPDGAFLSVRTDEGIWIVPAAWSATE